MPSGLSRSANRRVIFRPGSPAALSRTTPAKFWPMSSTYVPGFGSAIDFGFSSAKARTGGPGCHWTTGFSSAPRSTGCQPLSSNPGASQPGIALRAS